MTKIENLPQAVTAEFYQEAIDTFWAESRNFMVSLYRAGNINFPGLSDLDLVAVPKQRPFAPLMLSVLHVLPDKFRAILLHNTLIVPQSHLAIFRYSALSNLTHMHGEPILPDQPANYVPEHAACDVLERLYNYSLFWARQDLLGVIDVRFSVAVCSSIRFTMNQMADLGIPGDANYGSEFDAMRKGLMRDRSVSHILKMIEYSRQTYQGCLLAVRDAWGINAENRREVVSVITGAVALSPQFNPDIIRERFRAITEYLRDLVRLRYWYGNVVSVAVHEREEVPLWYYAMAPLAQRWRRACRALGLRTKRDNARFGASPLRPGS